MNPALCVLAAGASERLGTCKALVDLAGKSALARLLEAGAGCDGAPPLVVGGAHHAAIAAAAPRGVEVLANPRWKDGRLSGIALAARARAGLDLVLAPVDVPLVPAEVFARLAADWAQAGAPARGWIAPWVAGAGGAPRFGHPVLAGRELLRELAGDDERAAKDFPYANRERRFYTLRDLRLEANPLLGCAVESERILDDLDQPSDLARLRQLLS